jgi:hypothetical protein
VTLLAYMAKGFGAKNQHKSRVFPSSRFASWCFQSESLKALHFQKLTSHFRIFHPCYCRVSSDRVCNDFPQELVGFYVYFHIALHVHALKRSLSQVASSFRCQLQRESRMVALESCRISECLGSRTDVHSGDAVSSSTAACTHTITWKIHIGGAEATPSS